ncbi:MAG: hypothetical protein ABI780_00545, partial [Ardenticatenales bacterium]
AGAALTVALTIDVLAPPHVDLQRLIHLRRRGEVAPVAQGDGPVMQQGLPYPSSLWSAGERLVDERRIDVPPDVAAGQYEVATGFYRLDDLVRVPLTVRGVDDASRAYVLPRPVEVRRCP